MSSTDNQERLRLERELAETRAELAKVKRWFDTLDAQVKVLDRERQKFAAVVGQSDMPMFVADHQWVVRWSNAALKSRLELLGKERNVGVPVQEVWDLLQIGCAPCGSPGCAITRAIAEGRVIHDESRQKINGESRSLYLTALPIRAPDGGIAEVLVMIQDLSDLEILRRSEARYRLIFERSPDAMIMAEPESNRILLANPATSELIGYGARELASLALDALYDPENWPEARGQLERVGADNVVLHAEHRLNTEAGDRIVANVTASRFDLDGRPVALIELQDVSVQRRLEAELRHSQKMEAVGRLAGGIAHEFNNIMMIILGQADLLAIYPNLDDELMEISNTTVEAAQRAALLTRRLLTFSRKDVVSAEILDLMEVTGAIESLVRNLLGERVNLNLSFVGGPCPVEADRAQLEQVVINLAANARDAMPTGGSFSLEIARQTGEDGQDQARLTARDDGEGMDATTCARLFEPFFTTKGPNQGTGLGMSAVYSIVERWGGSIAVDSELGEGTVLTILLPLELESPIATATPRKTSIPTARGEERVLVVDDEAEVRRMAARLLRLSGYAVTIAATSDEAITACDTAEMPFDLLLTDVVMPGLTGSELAAEIQRRSPATRILYMSGYSDEEVVHYGVKTAGVGFVQKPFGRSLLMKRVRELLDA